MAWGAPSVSQAMFPYWLTAENIRHPTSASLGQSISGEFLSPTQQRRLDELYPLLQQQFLQNSQPQGGNAFLQLLSQAGGAPLAARPSNFGQPYDFGQAADFGPRADFGQVAAYPAITSGPVWSPQQVDERVNQGRARAQQQLGSEQRNLSETLAGKGYAGGSPLERELLQNMYALNLAGQSGAENDLRWGAAQGNARHLLETQQADVERSRAMGEEDVRRRHLGTQFDLERRTLGANDDLQRKRLASADQLQRLQSSADDRFRWSQAADQSDLERRRLATQHSALQSQERISNQSAILQAMMQANKPQQRSLQRNEQASGPGIGPVSLAGNNPFRQNNDIWRRGLFG